VILLALGLWIILGDLRMSSGLESQNGRSIPFEASLYFPIFYMGWLLSFSWLPIQFSFRCESENTGYCSEFFNTLCMLRCPRECCPPRLHRVVSGDEEAGIITFNLHGGPGRQNRNDGDAHRNHWWKACSGRRKPRNPNTAFGVGHAEHQSEAGQPPISSTKRSDIKDSFHERIKHARKISSIQMEAMNREYDLPVSHDQLPMFVVGDSSDTESAEFKVSRRVRSHSLSQSNSRVTQSLENISPIGRTVVESMSDLRDARCQNPIRTSEDPTNRQHDQANEAGSPDPDRSNKGNPLDSVDVQDVNMDNEAKSALNKFLEDSRVDLEGGLEQLTNMQGQEVRELVANSNTDEMFQMLERMQDMMRIIIRQNSLSDDFIPY